MPKTTTRHAPAGQLLAVGLGLLLALAGAPEALAQDAGQRAGQVTAAIPASDIAAAGNATVTATNPGTAASNGLTFTINSGGTADFTASITYPAAGATVSGTQSVGLSTTAPWGQSKTWTLSVNGTVITSQTNTGTTLWVQWNTTASQNGDRTLRLDVTMNGQTATATRPVRVSN